MISIRSIRTTKHLSSTPHRLQQAPDIPTACEAGLPGLEVSVWNGMWAPAGTPKHVIAKINAAVNGILSDEDVRHKLIDLGYEMPAGNEQSPEALAALHKAEIKKWWPIIRESRSRDQIGGAIGVVVRLRHGFCCGMRSRDDRICGDSAARPPCVRRRAWATGQGAAET